MPGTHGHQADQTYGYSISGQPKQQAGAVPHGWGRRGENRGRRCGSPRYGPAVDDKEDYFGERVAAAYDESSADMFGPGAVDAGGRMPWPGWPARLAGLWSWVSGAGASRCPRAARRGVPVHGIDLSRAMAARLRAKPGGDAIGVTIGDFATTPEDGTFSVAYLVFNTIMNLMMQAEQVACFGNAAAHLEAGRLLRHRGPGFPTCRRLPPGQAVVPFPR